MSNRYEVEGRTIHPRALKELGEEACIVALGVALDLRSGVIPPADYDQGNACGTSCCIAGHMSARMIAVGSIPSDLKTAVFELTQEEMWLRWENKSVALWNLFDIQPSSDPFLASDAIYRYIYDGSETPWTPS